MGLEATIRRLHPQETDLEYFEYTYPEYAHRVLPLKTDGRRERNDGPVNQPSSS